MDDKRTKPGGPLYWLKRRSVRFWIVVTLLLPVYYVAGFGPLLWLDNRGYLPKWIDEFDIWAVVLPAVGVAFAASCVWLVVRIINLRKKPGKAFWAKAAVAGLLLYPLSVGPVVGLSTRIWPKNRARNPILPYVSNAIKPVAKPIVDLYCEPCLWIARNLQADSRSILHEYIDWWRNPRDQE